MKARSKRDLYVEALDALLGHRIVPVARARDWELLREIARLAQSDAPRELAMTDPALYRTWRAAVTRFHLGGWSGMTPERVDEVRAFEEQRKAAAEAGTSTPF
jgi:hypothetical protein